MRRSKRWSSRREPVIATPPVSVVIATYNRRDQLERTLVALRDQTYSRYEVVVVNGPSTDGTGDMLDRLSSRARLVTCDVASVGAARNIGVALAAGDIVASIDDDAIPGPDWIESLVDRFADERVAAVGGPVFDVPLDRVEWNLCTCDRLGVPNTNSPGPIETYLGRGADPFVYLAGCNMSVRRSALQEIGGFNAQFTNAYDDVDVCCRLIDAGHMIAYVDKVFVRHDRATSAVRDGGLVIRDPYPIIYARAVFSLQCSPSPYSDAEIAAAMMSWAVEWRNAADQRLADGELSDEERQRFVERAAAGAVDGIAAGREGRRGTKLPEAPRHLFRPYRQEF